MERELKFADFLGGHDDSEQSAGTAQQHEAVEDATDGEEILSQEAGNELDSVEATEEASTGQEQEAVSTEPRPTFEERMRARGMEPPSGVESVELYDLALERIAAGTQALQEVEQLRMELEKFRSQQSTPSAPAAPEVQPTVDETPTEKGERLFRELKDFDRSLLKFIEQDDDGTWVPRGEYGQIGVEAAQTVNAYEREQRRQADLLLRNPNLIIEDNLSRLEKMAEEKAKAIVEARFKSFQEEQQLTKEQIEKQTRESQRQKQLEDWHEANKAKLFNLTPEGELMTLPFDNNQYSKTPTGRYFISRLEELRKELPGVDELKLRNIALREAEMASPARPAEETPPQPEQTPAQQRKKFVEQRQTQPPHQSVPRASASEAVANERVLRFADMVRRDPANQEIISSW